MPGCRSETSPPPDSIWPSRRWGETASMAGVRIAQWMRLPGIEARTRVYADGHAAGAGACREALADLKRGAVERAVVCGVDSLIEPETLRFFLAKRRLKTGDQPDGFAPGEAA